MPLILPDNVARRMRPLKTVPLQQLLDELQHRQILHEMTISVQLPNFAEQPELLPEQIESLKQQGFSAMFAQVAEALRQSGLCLAGITMIPPNATESLVLKVAVIKHPQLLQAEEQGGKVQVKL